MRALAMAVFLRIPVTSAVFLGALAASALGREETPAAGDKEAVGFDEVLPAEPEESQEKAPVRPEERPARRDVRRVAPPRRQSLVRIRTPEVLRRGVSFSVQAGGLFPMKGSATEHGPALGLGARALKRLGPRTGISLAFDYANPNSGRGASEFFLVQAGLRLRLSGDDISTCPLYAGLGVGVAAEAVTDDYAGDLPGNLGLAVRAGLGVRLGRRLSLGLGYVAFPDSENSPGVVEASLGLSF